MDIKEFGNCDIMYFERREIMPMFCRDCIYQLKPMGAEYKNHPESLCKRTPQTNFVTGEVHLKKCKDVNTQGSCFYWKMALSNDIQE